MGSMIKITLAVYILLFPLWQTFQVETHTPKNTQTSKATFRGADGNVPTPANVNSITNWTVNKMKVISDQQQSWFREKGEKAQHYVKMLYRLSNKKPEVFQSVHISYMIQ